MHKLAQTLFVLHETWHTTLLGKYYCVEVVRIENHCHMLQITCYVAILRVYKRFLHFCSLNSSNMAYFVRNLAHNTIWYILLC